MSVSRELRLPTEDGRLELFCAPEPTVWPQDRTAIRSRVAFAAAHVVADPLKEDDALDWDATLAYRRLLWSHGLCVAEAMDTAQRGGGLDWPRASDLIRRSSAEARACGGVIFSGAGTDQIDSSKPLDLPDIIHAYEEQCEHIEQSGSRVIIMASRALPRLIQHSDGFRKVYDTILAQCAAPVILHWLGEAFDPALKGYWGAENQREAMNHCLEIIRANATKVDGIKLSVLDAELEMEMRERLPKGVRMYTGDDFNYMRLIENDDEDRYSDALLGVFDAIAPAAGCAMRAMDRGDLAEYRRVLTPTVPLAHVLFEKPTFHYKTGIVFLAYLNGYQRHFRMVAGKESARSAVHLGRVMRAAADAGLLIDPELAVQRMRLYLTLAGVY